jgi:serine/threonine protein kinase
MPILEETQVPPQRLRSVDAACDAFELALCQDRPARIEDHVGAVPEDLRPVLLSELIRIELEWRCRAGQRPAAAEYDTRFPSCAGRVEAWLAEARASARLMAETQGGDTAASDPSATGTFDTVPPAAPAVPPRRLGEYELLEPLGAGGMGEVYRARHVRLDKVVALKLLPANSLQRKERLTRFLREMKALGSLDHPNLVEAYDAGESGDVVYLAMKLVEGADLGKLVRERGPLLVPQVCDLARQAALGLDYLHQRRLVHRDIKPSNLMRTPAGVVKVLDLGLARWNQEEGGGEATTMGVVLGTPDYLAPEQAAGERVDARTDVYGLGGTLFYLLTGRAPFAHRTGILDKLHAHRHEAAPDVRSLRPEVPAALAALVGRMLAKRPEDRPRTAAEVAAALAAFDDDSSADTVALAVAPSSRRAGSQRRRWALAAGAGGLAVLLALTVPLLWRIRHQGDTATPPTPPVRPEVPEVVVPRVEVLSLEVKHFANVNRHDYLRGVLGRESFVTRLNDSVTVEAQLSRPAYAYLIAFRPDGEEEVCFPEKEDRAPPLDNRPRYPSISRKVNYGLEDGEGLQAFVLVVSSKPLPAYREWRKRQGESPWRKALEAAPGVVWRDNGEEVEAFTADHPAGQRGKGREVTGKTPLVKLTDWLRRDKDVEAVAAVGFVVMPAARP